MDPLNDNVASLLHQSSDHFVSELWKEGESGWLRRSPFHVCALNAHRCKIYFKLKRQKYRTHVSLSNVKKVENVLTVCLSSPSRSSNISLFAHLLFFYLHVLSWWLLSFSPFTNLVLPSFPPLPLIFLPGPSFLLPASDIQTLPRVYFFDSYATLQANGSDSRFLSSSVCHAETPRSRLCSPRSVVVCPCSV